MWDNIQNLLKIWRTPYKRYQHQRLIHTLRLAMAVVLGSVVAHVFHLAHGEWISITVFVVLGTMQYQGAITAKAWERMFGTMCGLVVGIVLLWLDQHLLHRNIGFFVLVGVISAVCGWKSLGKHGYTAMLAGLTMCMLLGHASEDWAYETMMRGLNVVLGALIALGASQLIPIKSMLMWRFIVADNLVACSRQLAAITSPKMVQQDEWLDLLAEQRIINARLVKARSMINAAANESHISINTMESMQQTQRGIVSSVNLMLSSIPKLPKPHIHSADEQLLSRHFASLQHDLRLTARLLKGEWRQHIAPSFDEEDSILVLAAKLPFEWQGFIWTSLNIRAELFTLLTLLQYQRENWLLKSERERLDNENNV